VIFGNDIPLVCRQFLKPLLLNPSCDLKPYEAI
jgi:hypothetical protein